MIKFDFKKPIFNFSTAFAAFALGLSITVACSMGQKLPRYSEAPVRADDETFWYQCPGEKKGTHICREVCDEFNKKNECEKSHWEVRNPYELLEKSYVMMSKSYYYRLIGVTE